MGNKHVLSWAFALAVTATVALAVPFGGGGAGFTPEQINGPVSAFGVPQFTQDTPITQQHFTYGIGGTLLTSLRVPTGTSTTLPFDHYTLDAADTVSVNITPTVTQNQVDVTLMGHEIQ